MREMHLPVRKSPALSSVIDRGQGCRLPTGPRVFLGQKGFVPEVAWRTIFLLPSAFLFKSDLVGEDTSPVEVALNWPHDGVLSAWAAV